jgi:chromosome segregation ATPase
MAAERADDPTAAAYEERTLQLHEARAALGEAVHTLRLELAQARQENVALRQQLEDLQQRHTALHDEWKALGAEVEWLRKQRTSLMAETARLEQEVHALKNMRVVRWSAWPRRILHRRGSEGG